MSIWIDLILFKDILLFILLTIPETPESTLLFCFHVTHLFTPILGCGSLIYLGNPTTACPLVFLSVLGVLLDSIAMIGHMLIARNSTGRNLGNQIVYTFYAALFVVNNCLIIARLPRVHPAAAQQLPKGIISDMAKTFGGSGDGRSQKVT